MSLRSVNHRGLDLHFQQSSEFAPLRPAMRALLKERIGRGHVELRVSLARDAGPRRRAVYNRERSGGYVAAFRRARKELRLDCEPDLNLLLGLPGVLGGAPETKELGKCLSGRASPSAGRLYRSVERMPRARRTRAGRRSRRASSPASSEPPRRSQQLRAEALAYYHPKLREKLNELLAGSIPENRLAEEAALLAERSDIEEELTRLGIHAKEMRRMVQEGGDDRQAASISCCRK